MNLQFGCRNIYSRIVYSRTIYPNIFTLRLKYSLGILPHGILILKYFYSVEIQFSGIFHPWTIYPKILCSMDQLSYGEFYLKFFCTKDFMSFRSLTLKFFWTLDYLPQDFVYQGLVTLWIFSTQDKLLQDFIPQDFIPQG